MKIAVSADLHLGITDAAIITGMIDEIGSLDVDAVVVAGDLGEPCGNFRHALNIVKRINVPTGICAGNHDIWNRTPADFSSRELFESTLPRMAADCGVVWLEQENLVFENGVAIAGSIVWYDYSDRAPTTVDWPDEIFGRLKYSRNNDANFVRWDWTDIEFARRCRMQLKKRLGKLEDDDHVTSVVLATHVPIFPEQLVYLPGDDPIMRSYFANFTLGSELSAHAKIRHVVSGHTHRAVGPRKIHLDNGRTVIAETVGSDYGRPTYTTILI